jgi:FAD/FMN-containing dehydrogenase
MRPRVLHAARRRGGRVAAGGDQHRVHDRLNRTLYERARDMGGYRMTSSAVEMSQDDWKHHYGPAWQIVQAAKAKFDPKNVLTPGLGMFPS